MPQTWVCEFFTARRRGTPVGALGDGGSSGRGGAPSGSGCRACDMSMKVVATLSTLLAVASAHGGLTFPRPRNNFQSQDPAVRTKTTSFHNNGAFCTGDECLWFNEGCWIGCATNCSSKMPANNPKAKGYEKAPGFTYNTCERVCFIWSCVLASLAVFVTGCMHGYDCL